MSEKAPYFKLGLFVFAGILIFAIGIFPIGKQKLSFSDTFEVEALFNNAGGLRKGAPVRVTGVEKGVVDKLIIPADSTGKVQVIMNIDKEARRLIGPNAVAHIRSQGFF